MEKRKKYEIDMCNGPILGKLLTFAVPLMLSGMLQLLFNAADVVMVGRFAGNNSLAAVGSTSSLINLLTNLFIGLSIGTNVLIAREYASGKTEEIFKTVHTSLLLGICSGVILTIVGVTGARVLLTWMKTPDNVLGLAVTYLRIYFLGMTATMIYNFGSAILRAVGDTKRPLYYLMAAGIINVVLNFVFVVVFDMDVAGVAIATAISQCISALLVVRCLIREKGAIKLELKKMHIYKDKFISILKIGLPAGFQGILFSLSNVVIQSSVNLFGETVVAGNSASSSVEGFVYVGMNAFYQAAISFTSQNAGAGKYDRIKKILFTSQACVIIAGLGLGNLVRVFGEPLLGFYSDSAEVVDVGMIRLNIIAGTYALCGMMDVMVGMIRGLGSSVIPMIVSLIGACGLRLVWIATVFQIEKYHTIQTIYYSYPITWTITFTAHVICFIAIYRKRYRMYAEKMQPVKTENI